MPLLGFSQTRYLDDMFSSIVVNSDVQYGTNISTLPLLQGLPPAPTALLCDIYEPANDSMTDRPVIILLHTGSFLPAVLNGQATGSKSDLSIVENCTRWAKKGYVAVAMNYRQGWNPTSSSQQVRTSTLLQASYRAQQDAKAMVRYMRKTVAEDGNNYGIDDSRIIIGGQGTGASIVLAYITLDTTAELYLPKFMDLTTTPPTPFVYPPFMGNIDGTDSTYLPDFASPTGTTILSNIPNNPSYSNDVNMAFNLGGTLVDLSWLDNSGIPLVSFHCENDPFADIDSGVIIVPATGDIVVTDVVGSRTVAHYNTLWGNNAGFNQAGFTDTLTQLANTYNNTWDAQYGLVYDGLYVFDTPDPSTTPNPFGEMPYHESSPWDWWDNTTYDMMFQVLNGAPAGYGAANSLLGSPNMSQAHANLYLDTIHGYLNPRIYEVLFHSDTIGCTDSLAQNYDQNAIFDDGSCLYCDLSSLISSSAPSSNSSCDGFAFTTPTSSFPIVSYSWVSSSGILVSTSNFVTNLCSDGYIVTVVDSLGCTSIDTLILGNVYGCTDPLSFSYSWPANIDDGSCTYCVATTISSVAPTSSTSCNGFAVATSTSSFPIVSYLWANSQGSIIDTSNYVTNLCAGTYIITVFDSVGCSTVDTLFLGDVYGCTDPSAFNYSWYSNIDDGSCIPIISGCIDVSAINYDSLANTNDGSCCLINQTIQIGQDIDGENAGDYSGQSVSLSSDGNTLAVGAHRNDGNGSNAGHVRLYTKISDPNFGTWTWSQIGQDIDGEAYYDESGQSVSLSSDGNTVAIGAYGNDGNGSNSGHVRLYTKISDPNIGTWTWSQIGQDIDGEAANDHSGWSVSLSSDGNTVAIGAPYNAGNGSYYGHVRLYTKISDPNFGTWTWSQIGQDIDGEAQYDFSGSSVSLSSDGNTVAIGANGNDGNGSNSGHVRIYENIAGSWSQIGQDIDGENAGDYSGKSVSLSSNGNTVAIGAPYNDGNWNNSGHVRIYENIGGSWSQLGQDIDGENAADYSGQSVSLSSDGNTLAVGAHSNDGNGSNAGHVRLYTKISDPNFGTWTWSQIGQDIDGEAYYDESGQSVSLSSDGNTVAIGATGNDGNGYGSGHVRVYSVYSDCAGCIDPLALNYDSTLVYDDGSCIYPSGCTDPIAYNYDTIAITDDGSCLYCDLTNNFFVNSNTPGNCDGFILATSSSSNTPISYLWNNGSTQNNIISLCAGIYSLTITDDVGCVIEDTVFMNVITGCTDSLASNYDPLATYDDGSCTYSSNCTSPKPDGLYAYDVIDTRAKIGWNNMNSSDCMVWKYFVRYREVGTNGWTTKSAGVGNGLCNFGLNTVDKQLLNLTPSTTYEFKMKAFYCGGTSSNYSPAVQFTTSDVCPDMTNLSVQTFNSNQSKAKFTWDTTGTYVFARILLRVDTAGASWLTAGGFGVYYPTLFVNKFGLQSGESYRAQGRTFCDQNITAYRSPSWTTPIFWTQPGSIRLQGGTLISDLDVYPNPSRDVFNISFNSDEIQDLSIRILNLVGAEIYREEKQEFIGEYTKQINLDNYGKGIYFLEIATNNGVVNKKLILQ